MTAEPYTSGGAHAGLVWLIRCGYRQVRVVAIAVGVLIAGWATGLAIALVAFLAVGPREVGGLGQELSRYLSAGARAGAAAGAVAVVVGSLLWRSEHVRSGLRRLLWAARLAVVEERAERRAGAGFEPGRRPATR